MDVVQLCDGESCSQWGSGDEIGTRHPPPPTERWEPRDGRQQTLMKTAGWKEAMDDGLRNRMESELWGVKEFGFCFVLSFYFKYPGLRSVVLGDLALLQELFRRSSFQCLRRWGAVRGGGKKGRKKMEGYNGGGGVTLLSHGADREALELWVTAFIKHLHK